MNYFVKTIVLGGSFIFGTLGCSFNGSAGPCHEGDPQCNMDCSDGQSCPFGSYCGDSLECTSDCVLGGSDCEASYVCSGTGQCVKDAPPLDCPDVTINISEKIPTVVLLVDQSGSMNSPLEVGGPSRWDAVKTVLLDPTDGVVTKLDGRVNFGASLYSSVGGGSVPDQCPIINESLPAANSYQTIVDLFDANSPSSDTPTAESVDAVVKNFASFPGPRVIVLATDGSPDRCDDADAHDQQSRDLSEAAVGNAFDEHISTFVLSVGDQVAESHLQRLANAGQGLDLDNGIAPFFVATDSDLLQAAFESIITGVRSCDATLDAAVDSNRVGEGEVTLNGTVLVFNTDWRLVDERTIELLGDACQTMLSASNVVLQASFPCGIIID